MTKCGCYLKMSVMLTRGLPNKFSTVFMDGSAGDNSGLCSSWTSPISKRQKYQAILSDSVLQNRWGFTFFFNEKIEYCAVMELFVKDGSSLMDQSWYKFIGTMLILNSKKLGTNLNLIHFEEVQKSYTSEEIVHQVHYIVL